MSQWTHKRAESTKLIYRQAVDEDKKPRRCGLHKSERQSVRLWIKHELEDV